MGNENRRASDIYNPWKTCVKAVWALIAGFVAYVGPDLLNAAIVYFSDEAKLVGLLSGIPEDYKPAARILLLALIAAGRNWSANRKKV